MNPSRLVAMNTDALILTSGFLRNVCLLETTKIDVPTDPSQVLDCRTVAPQCPKDPRSSRAVSWVSATHSAIVGNSVNRKPLIYAGSANSCNTHQPLPRIRNELRSAVRVRSSALYFSPDLQLNCRFRGSLRSEIGAIYCKPKSIVSLELVVIGFG